MNVASSRRDLTGAIIVIVVAIALWVPRLGGPIDLRWDGGVYYLLGTSLAEGRGYRLLNEPGQIEAVQYPPLLPAIVAVHQRLAGTADPTTVGRWLRLTTCIAFVALALAIWSLLRGLLPRSEALLGTLLSLLSLQTWFLSNALYPELWFALATLLFVIAARTTSRQGQAMAYLFAVASYALRTVGLAALVVWTLDSVLRGHFRQAAWRAAFALVPILAWQGYVASVERSDAYLRPAYEYQRAPYMFYNVSYPTNIVLRDPFTPEKGEVMIARRIVRNALDVPVSLGETLTIPRGYFEMALHGLFGNSQIVRALIVGVLFTSLSALGIVLVGGGVLLELLRRRWVVPLYIAIYVAAICLAPFPGQYLRYLMPIAALLALSSLLFLRSIGVRPLLVLGPALALQLVVVAQVYAREYEPISYVDAQGQQLSYRLFFYNESGRGFDDAVDYLRAHADPSHIVAAGTPHWIYLRTGLQSVMPPFEQNAEREQHLLETVPVEYLVVGHDVVGSERYTGPMVKQFADRWTPVYSTPVGGWVVYRRAGSSATWLDASRSEHRVHEPSGGTRRK